MLEPFGWKEWYRDAESAVIEDRLADATLLLERAVAAVPAGERSGDDYYRLLVEAARLGLYEAGERLEWDEMLLNSWLDLIRREPVRPLAPLVDAVVSYTSRIRGAEDRLWPMLIERLQEGAPSRGLVALVICTAEQHVVLGRGAAQFFLVLANYWRRYPEEVRYYELVEPYCARASKQCRLRGDRLAAELWLQRIRRFGQPLGEAYKSQENELATSRKATSKIETLPPSCQEQEESVKIGEKERSHLRFEAIQAFWDRTRILFPFARRLVRVEKDPRVRIQHPTLPGLNSIARHLPAKAQDPGNIVPLILDSSFTGDGTALRMNIELVAGATSAQRAAARTVMSQHKELFDSD